MLGVPGRYDGGSADNFFKKLLKNTAPNSSAADKDEKAKLLRGSL